MSNGCLKLVYEKATTADIVQVCQGCQTSPAAKSRRATGEESARIGAELGGGERTMGEESDTGATAVYLHRTRQGRCFGRVYTHLLYLKSINQIIIMKYYILMITISKIFEIVGYLSTTFAVLCLNV